MERISKEEKRRGKRHDTKIINRTMKEKEEKEDTKTMNRGIKNRRKKKRRKRSCRGDATMKANKTRVGANRRSLAPPHPWPMTVPGPLTSRPITGVAAPPKQPMGGGVMLPAPCRESPKPQTKQEAEEEEEEEVRGGI